LNCSGGYGAKSLKTLHWPTNREHASETKERLGSSRTEVTLESLEAALCRTAAWKAPGFDGVFGFFIKKVSAVHEPLLRAFTAILNDERTHPLPVWFTTGRTVLIPKNRSKHLLTDDNARPINCLPGLYKLLTKTIEMEITQSLDPVLTDEQKGCRSRVFGAQHQLIIDRVLTEQDQQSTKDLAQVWLDMRKAFDSVSHHWILRVLAEYGIDQRVVNTIKRLAQQWRTVLTAEGRIISDPIPIRSIPGRLLVTHIIHHRPESSFMVYTET
jgi:hypothetical protein